MIPESIEYLLQRLYRDGNITAEEYRKHRDYLMDEILRNAVFTTSTPPTPSIWTETSDMMKLAHEKMQNHHRMSGLDTGLTDLNTILSGLQPTQLMLLASRPAMGKTTLSLNILLNLLKRDCSCAWMTFGGGAGDWGLRLLGIHSGINVSKILNQPQDSLAEITESAEAIDKMPLSWTDGTGMNIQEIQDSLRNLKSRVPNLQFALIDDIHEIDMGEENHSINAIVQELKNTAEELNIAILGLSRVHRRTEKRRDKRPRHSDIVGGKPLLKYADVVAFLYRDVYYHIDSPESDIAEIIVAFNKSGSTGTIKVKVDMLAQQFCNLPKKYLDASFS